MCRSYQKRIRAQIPPVDLNNPRTHNIIRYPPNKNQKNKRKRKRKKRTPLSLKKYICKYETHTQHHTTVRVCLKIMMTVVHCFNTNSVPQLPHKTISTYQQQFNPLFISNTSPLFSTPRINPLSIKSNSRKISKNRVVSALVSEERVGGSGSNSIDAFKLTYLEGNSWLWEVGGVKILVDPILVGNLDFGIPILYDAAKKYLKNFTLNDLPELDCVLITQSLDDHCHLRTLRSLSEKSPDVRVIATPNAKVLLDPLFRNVIYLEPGQNFEIQTSKSSHVKVRATPGPVLGPPWQRPENGYIVTSPQGQSLYYEPHCVYNNEMIGKEKADIIITPVVKQLLPGFTLVSGQEDAVQLAKLLHSKFVVPMKNGDLDGKGILATLVKSSGTIESFKELLSKELPGVTTLEPVPGVPLDISVS